MVLTVARYFDKDLSIYLTPVRRHIFDHLRMSNLCRRTQFGRAGRNKIPAFFCITIYHMMTQDFTKIEQAIQSCQVIQLCVVRFANKFMIGRKDVLMLVIITGLFMIPFPTKGQTGNNMLNKIEVTDNTVSNGTLVYNLQRKQLDAPTSIDEQISAMRQRLTSQGVAAKDADREASNMKQHSELIQEMSDIKSRVVLTYTKDKRFVAKMINEVGKTHQEFSQIYDGQDNFLVSQLTSGQQVDIKSGVPEEVNDANILFGLYSGKSFVIGRGLSSLTNIKFIPGRLSSEVIIEGIAPDASSIRAVLDVTHEYVAKQIERRSNGQLVDRWILTDPVTDSHGTWFASHAVRSILNSNGQNIIMMDYKIISADFVKPNDDIFRLPFQQGMTIVDDRLGKPVVFQKVGKSPLTKDGLLLMTQKKLAESARIHADEKNYDRAQKRENSIAITVPLLIITGFAGLMVWIRKRRS